MSSANILEEKLQSLRSNLSSNASVVLASDPEFSTLAVRWSDFDAPRPGAIIKVATEQDVEQAVVWATSNNIKFAAQGGGHGYTSTWNIGSNDIIINLRAMRTVTIDAEAGTAVIGAGTTIREAVNEAHKNKTHLAVGTCNPVGVVGSTLGGGLSRMQGNYGLGVDNMLSARIVTAAGKCITTSAEENSDLWYGLRGAGHSFGIVTSMKMKSYPQINGGLNFMSLLVFTPDKIETISQLMNDLTFEPNMALHIFMMSTPPTFQPSVAVSLWYAGSEEDCRVKYKSLYAAGPVFEQSEVTPWDQVNTGTDAIISNGGFKPCTETSLVKLDPAGMRQSWDLYVDFVGKNPDAASSALMFELYAMSKVQETSEDETAYPHRHLPVHALAIVQYQDPSTEKAAKQFGTGIRTVWRQTSGMKRPHVYVNFACGDETAEEIYGYDGRVDKLKALKAKWDPEGHFNQYNSVFK